LSERRAGRVGRAHGLDGSFYVERPEPELLVEGAAVVVAGRELTVVRRAGTDVRPIVRLGGVDGRDLRGEELWVEAEPVEGEFDAAELVGCEVPGIGTVRRVVNAPSCDLLEVGDPPVLVPFVSDAVTRVDPPAGVIEVDLRFLGLERSP
jgi:16S rRNA processing protein RimM